MGNSLFIIELYNFALFALTHFYVASTHPVLILTQSSYNMQNRHKTNKKGGI